MPRQRRIVIPGEILHVMSRGIDGCNIFVSADDYRRFLRSLEENLSRAECRCYAWALMPNHFHLVLRPSASGAATMMRRINGSYARFFNKTHGRRGYLFQDRYKSLATQEYHYIRELIRYVHLNPLRAGIVRDLSELEKYAWTGHHLIMRNESQAWYNAKDALARFGKSAAEARRSYLHFLEEGLGAEPGKGPIAAVLDSQGKTNPAVARDIEGSDERLVGESEFVRGMVAQADREKRERRARLRNRPSLESIAEDAARGHGIEIGVLRRRGKLNTASFARDEFCRIARNRYEYTLAEVGGYLGITGGSVSRSTERATKRQQ